MKRTEFNPAKLGAFVVGAFLLAVLAVFLWGPLNDLWQKRYVIFFEETATGLDPGATVRLNGVAIGKVDSIDLFYDQNNKVYSAVMVQLDPNKVKRVSKGGQSFDDMLHAKDISAQLGISGVVSFKLDVELKVEPLKSDEFRVWERSDYKKYYGDKDWIPARESTIAKVMQRLQDVLNSQGITNLIGSISSLLDESTTNHLIAKTAAAVESIDILAINANEILVTNKLQIAMAVSNLARISSNAGPQLDALFAKLDSAADSVQTNVAGLGAGVVGMSTNFATLSSNLQVSLSELDVVLRGAATLPPQAADTLREMQDTLQSMQRLVDYVERHPDSLLRGRAREK